MADHENLKAALRPCPVCDYAEATVLDTQRFILPENHPLGTGYDVVCCSSCGFAYADTAASQADYDRFYASHSKYQDARTSTGSGLTAWDAERLRETAGQIARFEGNRDARIVDIGCANGGLLAELQVQGFSTLCGLDPSEACARHTRLLPEVEAWEGGLSKIPVEAGRFDGIVLSHVLEHVRDLQSALAEVRRFLQPGGWVYAETPDAMRYAEFIPSPFQDFNTEHINHFSTTSMNNLLRSCEFEPVNCGTKTILSAPDMPYPALFVYARMAQASDERQSDQALRESLREYIRLSRQLLARMNDNLALALRGYDRIVVWGTGQLTLKLLTESALSSIPITQFIDSNPANQGRTLRGAPIIAPGDLQDRTVPILVASTINAPSIREDIRRLNLPNPTITLSTH